MPIETFAKKKDGPLQIKGRLITSGTYKDSVLGEFKLSTEELHRSMQKWIGIPIFTSHNIFQEIVTGKNPSIRDVVGKITSVSWNPEDEGIDYFADIYDNDISEKIRAGLIRFISAGFARDVQTEKDGIRYQNYLINIEPGEASMVFNPRDPNAEFKAVQ
ncbi:MAG: hypothetical protein Q8O88_01395 [bacterium]|nr:hypothetical protein [bacterium]